MTNTTSNMTKQNSVLTMFVVAIKKIKNFQFIIKNNNFLMILFVFLRYFLIILKNFSIFIFLIFRCNKLYFKLIIKIILHFIILRYNKVGGSL